MKPQRILICRTDAIGDVVLTIPLASYIKENFPDSKVFYLTKDYTKDIIQKAQFIDQHISYNQLELMEEKKQIEYLNSLNIDTCIHVFPQKELVKLIYKTNIKNRIGTSRRLYNYLYCNKRVPFSRKKSNLHEAQLNFKLLSPIGIKEIPDLNDIGMSYHLDKSTLSPNVNSYLKKDKFNLIIHPFTVSGKKWPLEKFAELIKSLDSNQFNIILTGLKSDLKNMPKDFPLNKVVNLVGRTSLKELIDIISNADGLLAGSTGPLHIASAMGIHTIGIQTNKRPMHPGRWKPLGPKAEYIIYDPNDFNHASIELIEVKKVKERIINWL